MYHLGGTIRSALTAITRNDYVLPAIQRELVWSPDQICRLFDSVMQGYPIGDFLFWRIEPERSADYRYYGFVRDYHQRDDPHCPPLPPLPNQQTMAVLDGQQRLTAFNIGLQGSMAVKLPRKWWNSRDAFPRRVLALDLLAEAEHDENGNRYTFEFVDEGNIGRHQNHLWFKVADILNMDAGPDMHDWLLQKDLEKQQQSDAYRILDRLYQVIHHVPTIAYYEEKNQDIEHVLNIFIRRNSGGTVLSYSDLLLSIATSQWSKLDARKEVHQLVDDLNRIGPGLGLTKDFVLKAGLMLTDINSVGFQVRNFTRENMAVLERNWQRIRDALAATAQLVTGFGFDGTSIRATSALLPIAYYLYRIGSPGNFDSHNRYAGDRAAIRGWLIQSILKASGIWGSGLDTLLTALRDVLGREAGDHYPAAEMRRRMAQGGKSLEFSTEEIEDLADMSLNDRRLFALLALLSPFINFRDHHFHIDHVFPKSRFTASRLRKAGIDDGQIEELGECANRIGNLQLLDGVSNLEKQATLPAQWIEKRYPNESARETYCDNYFLGNFGDIPREIDGFTEFYEARRERLQEGIARLLKAA